MIEIKQILGVEPMREREYPIYYKVGVDDVTKIEYHNQNYGDHGIGEYRVWKGTILHSTVMHRALAEVIYAPTAVEDSQ